MFLPVVLILIINAIASAKVSTSAISTNQQKQQQPKEGCTDLVRDDETLLVLSTLGGGLTAIDSLSGEIRWQIDDEPSIKVPTQTDVPLPQYLPNPRDGSLYQLGDMGGLKKLPYTIPELVASAPCRSSDGILYSGRKSDVWYLVDPKTGRREHMLGFESSSKLDEPIGWATSRYIYLGRTQYTVLMYDSLSKNAKPWNVTFFDYTSHTMTPEISQKYEWLHLCGSASGLTVTLNRKDGDFRWQQNLISPVVAVFLLSSEGLLSVPFQTVSDDALKNIAESSIEGQRSVVNLYETLYVGEHTQGLYALQSLVEKNTATILSNSPTKLLEGPIYNNDNDNDDNFGITIDDENYNNNNVNNNNNNKINVKDLIYLTNNMIINKNEKNKNVIVLGNYQIPKIATDITIKIEPTVTVSGSKNIGNIKKDLIKSDNYYIFNINSNNIYSKENKIQTTKYKNNNNKIINNNNNGGNIQKTQSSRSILLYVYRSSNAWLNDQENKIFKLMVIIWAGTIIAMFWYSRNIVRQAQAAQQQNAGGGSNNSKTSAGNSAGGNSSSNSNYQELIDLGNGVIKVGKISFNSCDVLGKGCEGTFVFKGTFEKRNVAVKRLLPECFTFADREVTLLRESDTHENVVRYFCTEQDRQFRYIAVELCAATLQDYIESEKTVALQELISIKDILQQATNGLLHLHSLNIVHRDIKPQNVLLSLPNVNSNVRAMISDFGLCKKLNYGKTSFSRRSGITGTEGWIAPEMLKLQRTTTSVDIFSMGCVFYYVISKGSHPFGEPVKRQLNILSYEYDLKYFQYNFDSTKILAEELIKDMISKDALRRPSARAILKHPYFWKEEKILNFLQDVSDRVEKSDYSVEPLRTLEKNSKFIVNNDWNLHLDNIITADLRKYRGYHGNSVRDLLRALRNKKHHFHELNIDIQNCLGEIPIEFTNYWIIKFPYLLSHSYHALQLCSNENHFKLYYDQTYVFSKPDYFYRITTDNDFVPFQSQDLYGGGKRDKNLLRTNNSNTTKNFGIGKTITAVVNEYVQKNRKGNYNFHNNNNNDANSLYIRKNIRKRNGNINNINNNNNNNNQDHKENVVQTITTANEELEHKNNSNKNKLS